MGIGKSSHKKEKSLNIPTLLSIAEQFDSFYRHAEKYNAFLRRGTVYGRKCAREQHAYLTAFKEEYSGLPVDVPEFGELYYFDEEDEARGIPKTIQQTDTRTVKVKKLDLTLFKLDEQ
jgi:hypothetical protein